MIGKSIGHYQVLRELGGGGMGVVYHARDTRLGRDVAIKLLPAELAEDAEALRRFEREARAIAALNHPHISTLHDTGTHEGRPYLVLELLRGETLARAIALTSMPVRRVLQLGAQIADALGAAHAAGIIHRDIKPANVFVSSHGEAKVLDFGLAKILDPTSETARADSAATELALTLPGTTLGTTPYMSPEQVRGDELDVRTDLFSLGVVLYEMATGRRPFVGASAGEVSAAILKDAPPAATQLRSELPVGLDGVLARLLDKDRTLRYQSAADVDAELRRLLRDDLSAVTTPPPADPVSPDRHARWPWIVGVLSGMLVLVAAVALWRSSDDATFDGRGRDTSARYASIAVLPFQNLDDNDELDYLRLAMPDEVATTLARVRSLTVRPFAATSAYADGGAETQEIGSAVRASHLITGQYFQQGAELNVTLEAVDVERDRVLWRESIALPMDDVISLRRRVEEVVRSRLLPELGVDAVAADADPRDPEAYELYLRSLALTRRAGSFNTQAIEMLERSLELDPEFASAWDELGLRLYLEGTYGQGRTAARERADRAYVRATELDPELPRPALNVALNRTEEGELTIAMDAAERLIRSRPDHPYGYFARGAVYRYAGLLDRAREDCETAILLDPRNFYWRSCALTLIMSGDFEGAERYLELDAGSDFTAGGRGHIRLAQGDPAGALAYYEQTSEASTFQVSAGVVRHCDETTPESLDAAARARTTTIEQEDPERKYWFARLLTACGHRQLAFDLLRRAISESYCVFPAFDLDPIWKNVQQDPEFLTIRGLGRECRERYVAEFGRE